MNVDALATDSEDETFASFRMVFLLTIMSITLLIVHFLAQTNFHYIPESVVVILIGVLGSVFMRYMSSDSAADKVDKLEQFDTTSFFLFILPPIIFESGYSLQRKYFFAHFNSILLLAVLGTIISAVIVGFGVYFLGTLGLVYELSSTESFAFGSLISAVDPVATLAIFQSLDIDKNLFILVFGESVLNDAVSIVLTRTVIQLRDEAISLEIVVAVLREFLLASVGSAVIGAIFGFLGALQSKYLDMRKHIALEISTLALYAYLPYLLAESLDLSGIMAILFAGMTHAHYTRFNLSKNAQIAIKHSFRAIAYMSETAAFLYLGFAMVSFQHHFDWPLIVSSILLCLLGRALNIFPLTYFLNSTNKGKGHLTITPKMQAVMWFSGLRGAIAFALVFDLTEFSPATQRVLMSTTLVTIIFTISVFGGATWPLLKWLQPRGVEAHAADPMPILSRRHAPVDVPLPSFTASDGWQQPVGISQSSDGGPANRASGLAATSSTEYQRAQGQGQGHGQEGMPIHSLNTEEFGNSNNNVSYGGDDGDGSNNLVSLFPTLYHNFQRIKRSKNWLERLDNSVFVPIFRRQESATADQRNNRDGRDGHDDDDEESNDDDEDNDDVSSQRASRSPDAEVDGNASPRLANRRRRPGASLASNEE